MQILQIENIDYSNKMRLFNSHEKRSYFPNKKNELYLYRNDSKEIYYVQKGEICISGMVFGSGTVLIYEPKERRNFFALTEVECLVYRELEHDEFVLGKMSLEEAVAPYKTIGTQNRFNNIAFEEITVVVQGPVEAVYTRLVVESVRKYLPGAKIILSTWKDSDIAGLDVDELVINEDPGAPSFVKRNGKLHSDNRNRLLVSTKSGLQRVTTKYALKLRSDCILAGDGVVRNYGRYPLKTDELNITKNKLVIGELCNITRLKFAETILELPFHMSDWFFFGLAEDLQSYFADTETESIEQMTKWNYKNEMLISPEDEIGLNWKRRYNAEQYYFISALKRKYHIDYWDLSDYSGIASDQSRIAIVNNFEILNVRDHEIINLKRNNRQPWDLENDNNIEYFTNIKYEKAYKEMFCLC